MGILIIDGNMVYEIDDECMKKRTPPKECDVYKAYQKQKEKDKNKKQSFWKRKKGPRHRPFFDGNLLADAVVTAAAEEKQKDNPAAAVVAVKQAVTAAVATSATAAVSVAEE